MTSSPGKGRGRPTALSGSKNVPRVAILGRPNVGKSSLFNALLGKRRSITHSQPGVTRDPVEESSILGGVPLLLIDTGGFAPAGEALDRVVSERSLSTARDSDLILLVLDATETTSEDEDFMERLRPLSEKLLVVVNKVDTPDRDSLVWNAHSHGFPRVIGVSAVHGRNLPELKELIALLLEERRSMPGAHGEGRRETNADAVRIAILGKPNTGKSSLANRLLGENRSIVSAVPGTTRDVVEGSFEHGNRTFAVLDTAGIRRKSRVTDAVEYYSVNRAIESIERADLVFLMIDASEGLVDQDKKIAGQALKEGRGIIIVAGKWDLLDTGAGNRPAARKRGAARGRGPNGKPAGHAPNLAAQVSERIRFDFPVLGFAPIVPVSSVTGHGIRELLDTALSVWQQLHRRVTTGRLNAALESWTDHYPLPGRGKYKIKFATQVGSNPVKFVVFVNRVTGFPASYVSYLENSIRRDLGFAQVPIAIDIRRSGKADPRKAR